MKIYLVGGAVRDEILGYPVIERDWVVVGSSPEEMIAQGFKPVGKDFPVFLHPTSHEEYALARTERKTAQGYHGFNFYTSPDVTLEQDLQRRDLTINAIAKDPDTQQLIDPYGGIEDIKEKLLRHVSRAFLEDPVRLLRVCRFSARFNDFSIHPDTLALMRDMVNTGEIRSLVPERVWQELEKTLYYDHPERFFEVCRESHAFHGIFGDFINMISLDALKCACKISSDTVIRFAAVFSHLKEDALDKLNKKLRPPKDYQQLTLLGSQYRKMIQDLYQNKNLLAETLLMIFEKTDAFRRPERFENLLMLCKIDHIAQHPHSMADKINAQLQIILKDCLSLRFSDIAELSQANQIAEKIRQKRLEKINEMLRDRKE